MAQTALDDRRKIVRYSAVFLGVLAGITFLTIGLQPLVGIAKREGWGIALALAADCLVLLPVTALGIFRPILASYVLFVSVALSLAAGLYLLGFSFAFSDTLLMILFLGSMAVPTFLLALLLRYSARPPLDS